MTAKIYCGNAGEAGSGSASIGRMGRDPVGARPMRCSDLPQRESARRMAMGASARWPSARRAAVRAAQGRGGLPGRGMRQASAFPCRPPRPLDGFCPPLGLRQFIDKSKQDQLAWGGRRVGEMRLAGRGDKNSPGERPPGQGLSACQPRKTRLLPCVWRQSGACMTGGLRSPHYLFSGLCLTLAAQSAPSSPSVTKRITRMPVGTA